MLSDHCGEYHPPVGARNVPLEGGEQQREVEHQARRQPHRSRSPGDSEDARACGRWCAGRGQSVDINVHELPAPEKLHLELGTYDLEVPTFRRRCSPTCGVNPREYHRIDVPGPGV